MVDLHRLRQLMGNDEEMVKKFLNIYKTEVPEQLERLEKFIKNEDWNDVSMLAHSIKSQSKYLGIEEIVQQAYEMEKMAEKEYDLSEMAEKYNSLKILLNNVVSDDVFK